MSRLLSLLATTILVMIARSDAQEPRFQIRAGSSGQQVFGIDVENLGPCGDAIMRELIPFVEARFRRIGDKRTGVIDRAVAQHWRENYDLRHILVHLMEEFLENTTEPSYGGEVDYGDRAGHCWNGDHERPTRIAETAPAGADPSSWRY